MTTRKLRKCKYGDRLSNGKCPKKPTAPKTRKLRKCKYGERLSDGKCPKKPTAPKTRKLRKCKYGERLSNGKCPKKKIEMKNKSSSIQHKHSISPGIGTMDTKYLVNVQSSKEIKMSKNRMIDLLGETLLMDADADLQASTMKITSHTLTFELVHQDVDEPNTNPNKTYTKENIIKAIKAELSNVKITVTKM